MPEPRKGEKRSEYISRCVEFLIKKEGLERDHALGKCYGMWRSKDKKKKIRKVAKRKIRKK